MKKKILTLLSIIIILPLLILGCSSSSPKESVVGFLEGVKNMDKEAFNSYLLEENKEEFERFIKKSNFANSTELLKLFSDVSWKIESSNVQKDNAEVVVKITAIDMKSLLSEVMGEIVSTTLEDVFSGKQIDENDLREKMDKYVLDKAQDKKLEKKTSMIVFKLRKNKENKKWEIMNPEEIADVYGLEAIKELNISNLGLILNN